MPEPIIRIAMWSGPRNISTAMMRSWENRADTEVVDEPFYACYLRQTGIIHPMQETVLASQAQDWQAVIDGELTKPLSSAHTIQYQKHMTHHMVAEIDDGWFQSVRHAFLIRHPADVVASYRQKRSTVTPDDIGFARQRQLFERVCETGATPPVIESADVLRNPAKILSQLCTALNVPFDEAMLAWPAGRRESDGAWAPHWYQNVEQSTGFAEWQPKQYTLTPAQQRVVDACLPDYLALAKYKL